VNKQFKILGILGSGQLARMSAIAAKRLGYEVYIYCNAPDVSPAELVATKTFKGHFDDKVALLIFASLCDFVTLENEFISLRCLEYLDENKPNCLFPSSKTFKLTGDKISEKNHFKEMGIPVAPFLKVLNPKEVIEFAKKHSYPLVLKTSKGGYDGYGNLTLRNDNDVYEKFHLLKGELLIEAFIPYDMECAILVARNHAGECVTYPIAHTIQENHICHFVSVPAPIDKKSEEQIKEYALRAMKSLDAVGIFAFEFFITKNKDIYLNESAPRPHNSGHYSIEACETSQFDNHVRAVMNLPLGPSHMRAPHALMLNLLGTKVGEARLEPMESFLKVKEGFLHLYGKSKSKPGRKMGHFTVLGNEPGEILTTLKQLKESYTL